MPKINKNIELCFSPTEVTVINNKISTLYKKIPNFSPDLIYLDGHQILIIKVKSMAMILMAKTKFLTLQIFYFLNIR